jgi:hypothetical protein
VFRRCNAELTTRDFVVSAVWVARRSGTAINYPADRAGESALDPLVDVERSL